MLSRSKPFLLYSLVEEDFGAISLTVEKVHFLDQALT